MITHIGKDAGTGATINIPLPERTGDAGYQQVFESIVIPAARRFKPQLILASVGYDAHWRDPLAAMGLSLSGYTAITQTIASLSDELCESRLVCVLEGGYDLEVLRLGVHNTFCILMGDSESASNLIGPSHVMEPDITPLIRKVKQLHRL
jgi:acetoin utilization deacetylase AcuC-like enzyme